MSDQGIYVIVSEHDGDNSAGGKKRPVIFEQYVDQSSRGEVEARAAFLEKRGRYGKFRIARLEFVDEGKP